MKYKNKLFMIMIALILVINVFSISSAATSIQKTAPKNNYIDITVEEAWIMLNDPSPENGIQIPIDVRRDDEWKVEHIDTPTPENPIHYPLTYLQEPNGLQIFLSTYHGEEIILYCRTGSRSVTAANILINNGFNGTIYNMLGGITDWKSSGYPTVANQPPSIPEISGPTSGTSGVEYDFTLKSNDPDGDDVFYCINWSDGTSEFVFGPYSSNEEIIVSHTWEEKGTYLVKVKARDYYEDESDWATLEVAIPKNKSTQFFLETYFPRLFSIFSNLFVNIFI